MNPIYVHSSVPLGLEMSSVQKSLQEQFLYFIFTLKISQVCFGLQECVRVKLN